jgi:threonine dehydratase
MQVNGPRMSTKNANSRGARTHDRCPTRAKLRRIVLLDRRNSGVMSGLTTDQERAQTGPTETKQSKPSGLALQDEPTLADVLHARRRIQPYLGPTPLYEYPALSSLLKTTIWVKHENHQPIGAFKVRGGINLVSQLSPEEKASGVVTASTGNHGQSVAYAARLFGVPATICLPENANPVKVEAMQAMGAQLVFHGHDFDEARERCEAIARERGLRYIHSANEPLLIAGVATATLEILESNPDIDVLIVPVGGGSGAAGACVVAKALKPGGVRVIGVQSEAAPAAYLSWKRRTMATAEMKTSAEGLATRTGFELPQKLLWEMLDDFVIVSDDELLRATYLMMQKTKNLVEPSGAAPLAAALRLRAELDGKQVALMCTGGNISPAQLADVLNRSSGSDMLHTIK